MNRLIMLLTLVMVVSLGLVASCANTPSATAITDDLDRQVTIENPPDSVVSLAPSATEILYALDCADAIAGVTEACDYPRDAQDKPTVGAYYSTSLELIVDKDPDIVFSDGYDPVWQEVEKLGITVVVLKPDDIPGVLSDIELVGKVMDAEEQATRLVSRLQERLDAVTAKAAAAPGRPGVFLEVDASDPVKPFAAGPGSLADSMITLAGGRNVVSAGADWAQIGLEELLSASPEIIILSDYPYVTPEDVAGRQGAWQELPAVKQDKVFGVTDPSLVSRPGPRILDGLEEMAGIIHPEIFTE